MLILEKVQELKFLIVNAIEKLYLNEAKLSLWGRKNSVIFNSYTVKYNMNL